MLMKDGTVVPRILVQALENDIDALKVFMSYSETYQKLFVSQVLNSRDGIPMRERLKQGIKDLHKYGMDNGILPKDISQED